MSADVVVLGSSPNALACAARLAKGGARAVVLETRSAVGGPVATESFAPGYLADTGVASVSLDPEIERELGVHVELVRRDVVTALGAPGITLRAPPGLPRAFDDAVALLAEMERADAPSVPAGAPADAAALAALGARLRGLGARRMHEVLRLSFMSARDAFAESVEAEPVRALLAGVAVRALSEGP
ncbi:MAG TPA: NAD(P)-binding protein, partial [Minicystis sp.]|nr:NAD(P)-binding protein [Minicystis sp.]